MVGIIRIGGEIRINGANQRSKKLIDNEFVMTGEELGQGVDGSWRVLPEDMVYGGALDINGTANEPRIDFNSGYFMPSPADRPAMPDSDFNFTAGEVAIVSQETDKPIYAAPVPTLVLAPGGLAIIHYSAEDADDPSIAGSQSMDRDSLSFVLLAPLAAGAVIFFTDRAWNGTTFAGAGGGEGTFTFTAGANLPAGHVVTITTAQLNAAGINLNSGGLGGDPSAGETIFVYQGAINAPTNFIYALEIADGNNTFNATLAGTGLSVAANTATAIGADNASHAARTWNIQIPDLLDSINDPNDWVTNENSPQSPDVTGTNLFTAPDRQIWIAGSGGGDAIQIVNTDGSHTSNLLGYAIAHLYQNTSVDGNPTTQRFWHPTDVVLDTVNDKFFIVDSDGTNDRILQGSISQALNNPGVAPTMTVLYFQAADEGTPGDTGDDGSIGLTGMAIDTANGAIYFTGNNLLQKIVYNTANQTPVILANLGIDADTSNPTFANEIGLDLARGFVYIVTTESFSDFIESPPGSGIFVVGTVMYRNAIIRVSNVAPGDTNATGNTVDRVLWSGVYDEANGPFGPQANEFDDLYGRIISVDVNTTTGDIWFTTVQLNNGANGELGGIYRASIDAGGNATVTLVYQETNATNFNFQYIEIDEETGRYYVTSVEPNEANNHSLFSGLVTDVGVQPTFISSLGNINALSPLGLSVQSAPTLTGTGLTQSVTEASSAPSSGETTRVALYSGLTATDIDPPTGDELAGAQVRISLDFQSGATHQDFLRINGNTSGTIAGSGITYSYDSTNGVLTLSGPATVAEYAAALQLVTFSTSGDDPTAYGNALGRTVSASVFDGLLYSDEINATVNVTGINDAPVNTVGGAASVTEDGSAFAITGVSIFDVDANPASQDIVVTLSVALGTITVLTNVVGGITAGDITGGTNGSATITITATQNQINATLAAANGLTFTPPANYNGATTLTVTTNDLGLNGNDPGLTGTGTSEADTDNKIINIADVNDAPTVVDATQDSPTILEDVPFTNLNAPTVSSMFAASFADATDVQQTGGNPTGSVGDSFAGIAIVSATSNANGAWQYWDGDSWENITGGTQAAARTLTAGTQLRFNPVLNYNGAAPTLTVHLIESGGPAITNNGALNLSPVGTATGGTTVYSNGTVVLAQDITAVNDAPVNTIGGPLTVAEDGGATNVTGMSISDGDANPATSVFTVTLDVLHGSLNVLTSVAGGVGVGNVVGNGGATVTLTGTINQINATLAAAGGVTYTPTGDYNGSDRVQITTDDGGATGLDPGLTGTATSEADIDSKTITVTAVNDPVTGSAPPFATLDEDSTNFAISGMSISDADAALAPAGVYVVTLSSTNGTMTLTTLTGLTFSTGDGSADATMTFRGTLSAINTALATAFYTPAANHNGSATITLGVTDTFGGIVATGTGAATSDSDVINVTVTAVNDPVTTAAPATLSLNENSTNVAVTGLSISDVDAALDPTGVYDVTLSSTNGTMTLTTVTGLTFTVGDGTSDATMTFHGTLAAINTALGTASYTPAAGYDGSATITLSATDTFGGIVATGTGAATSDSDVVAVTVISINTPPVVDLDGTAAGIDTTASYTEGVAGIRPIQNIVLSDSDSANLTGATVTIVTGFVTGDLLRLSGGFSGTTASGITFGFNSITGVLTLSGSATVAAYQTALASLSFKSTNDNPGTARDITVVVNDGSDSSVAAHINLAVTATNDAPVNTVPGAQTSATSSTIVFSTANGNALTISDADAGAGTMRVRLGVDHGTLTLGSMVGLTVTGNGTGIVKITGTLAAINAALNGLTLQGEAGYSGAAALTITTHDSGNSGVGVNLSDTDTVAITWTSASQEGLTPTKTSANESDANVAAAFAPSTDGGYGDNGFEATPYPFNLGIDTILGSTYLI